MAEETKTNVVETTESNATDNTPTVEGTISKVEYDKLKSALDKALKEKGDITKQLRAKQSDDERITAEQAEAKRLLEEEVETLRAKINRSEAVNAYKSMSSEKVVENLIEAVSNADHNAIAKIIADECKKAVTEAETTWLKERPRVQHGQYSSMTAEQIMAIPDRQERARAIAMNQELFK